MHYKLLPLTPDSWKAYLGLCAGRGYQAPGLPPSAVLVAGQDDRWSLPRLVSGAVVYPLEARFVVIDHFVTNPQAPLRARRDAAVFTLRACHTMATIMGLTLAVHPRASVGLRRFCALHGLHPDPQAPFVEPGVRVPWAMFAAKKERAPKAPLPAEPELPIQAGKKMAAQKPKRKRAG